MGGGGECMFIKGLRRGGRHIVVRREGARLRGGRGRGSVC